LVFLIGLGAILQPDLRHILDIYLNPLPRVVHLVIYWLFTRAVFSWFYQSSPHQHPVDTIDAQVNPIISLKIKSQPARSIVAFLTQFHNELGGFLGHGLRVAFRTFRVILKTGKPFFGIAQPPLVESLSGYTKFPAHLTDIPYSLIPFKPS
jgi:hypothetical protein